MGNHSDTGELLEEARVASSTEKNSSGNALIDEFGNVIKLDQSPEELLPDNPTKLKDSSGRDVDLIQSKSFTEILTPKQADALKAKLKKNKNS